MNVIDPNFNLESFREFIRKQDDNKHNSLCVSADGKIYFQSWGTRSKRPPFPPNGFRFETFAAGNGYVGSGAADDSDFTMRLHRAIEENWLRGVTGYIDYWP